MKRRGMVLGICFLVLMLLGLMVGTIHMMSRQSYTELKRVDGFLRAVAVGESAFTRLLSRLESEPWARRWFKDSPDVGTGTWEDGRYEYVIGNASKPLEADLGVRATAEKSTVMMVWRLRADPATLAPHRRLRTVYFGYGDPSTPPGTSVLGPIGAVIDTAIATREGNRPWANEKEIELRGQPGLPGVGVVLGLPGTPVVPDVLLPPVPGGPPRDQGPVVGGGPTPPPVPTFPPPVVGGTTLPNPETATELSLAEREMEETMRDLDQKVGLLDRVLGGALPEMPQYSTYTRTRTRVTERRAECDGNPPTGPPCTPEERAALTECEENLARVDPALRMEYKGIGDEFFALRDRQTRQQRELDELRTSNQATESALARLRDDARRITAAAKDLLVKVDTTSIKAQELLTGNPCGRFSGL